MVLHRRVTGVEGEAVRARACGGRHVFDGATPESSRGDCIRPSLSGRQSMLRSRPRSPTISLPSGAGKIRGFFLSAGLARAAVQPRHLPPLPASAAYYAQPPDRQATWALVQVHGLGEPRRQIDRCCRVGVTERLKIFRSAKGIARARFHAESVDGSTGVRNRLPAETGAGNGLRGAPARSSDCHSPKR